MERFIGLVYWMTTTVCLFIFLFLEVLREVPCTENFADSRRESTQNKQTNKVLPGWYFEMMARNLNGYSDVLTGKVRTSLICTNMQEILNWGIVLLFMLWRSALQEEAWVEKIVIPRSFLKFLVQIICILIYA